MGVTTMNAAKYGELLSKTLPKVIETAAEFDRMVRLLEEMDFARRQLSPEEEALRELLAKLIQDYDDRRHPLPELPPGQMLRFLMEQRNLRQRDLIPVFGASSVASDVVNGKCAISKAHAKKLAEFFQVPSDLFL